MSTFDPSSSRSPIDGNYNGIARGQPPMPERSVRRQSSAGSIIYGAAPPLLDQSHLRPGTQAALLSHTKTLELYRANAKKTNDSEIIFEFAVFMIDASKNLALGDYTGGEQVAIEDQRDDLIKEATGLLKRLADRGHPDAQYFLADCYANGIGTVRGKQDFDRAFPMFVLAAKHGHPDAAYRSGTCCENGWGCRRESAKAVMFYKKAAAALHPGAMYRLGTAELNGQLGLPKRPKEGVKWLKRSAEHANEEFPHALHELAILHERGIDNVLFVDLEYSAELLAQASELGYAPSAYKLGECYEYGKMGCPQDAALSIHYYNIAAQQDHREACFALTAWYLVGSPGVLPQSDTEAYLWAKKAAEQGLAKAQYAVGYFSEVGIGINPSPQDALSWYKLAADAGDKRATQRLTSNGMTLPNGRDRNAELLMKDQRNTEGGGPDNKESCVVIVFDPLIAEVLFLCPVRLVPAFSPVPSGVYKSEQPSYIPLLSFALAQFTELVFLSLCFSSVPAFVAPLRTCQQVLIQQSNYSLPTNITLPSNLPL
ncbi:Extracellular protein SEL-1 and related proteins [Phaffia rhodozyma]|uniref:Extracellular protein SEL-1 and related proteins n=1 Tax=Phaffia rhodozyma TaxID=264483 RepID=A0A0F7SH73_PHARH|nr:Extracellular protein SEL-1 and related proteins [Phaffia rhodozyma]